MLALAIILLCLCALLSLTSTIWLVVNAFRTSVGWGLAVLFLPIGWLIFLVKNWEMARRPVVCGLISLFLYGAATTAMPKNVSGWPISALQEKKEKDSSPTPADANAEPKKPSTLPGMFAAQKKMELQIKLVALQRKSDDLLDRKAALAPGDKAGAVQLSEEIKKYNAELKAVTQEMRDRGIETAQR